MIVAQKCTSKEGVLQDDFFSISLESIEIRGLFFTRFDRPANKNQS